MPAYYRNCYQYSANNQKQPSLETVSQSVMIIQAYRSNKTPYLVTSDDTLDNITSLQKLQQKEDSFKTIHAACILLIDHINGSYSMDDNSQNEILAHLVQHFTSIEDAKNQLLLLAGEIEQNLYLIEQARFIERTQLALEDVTHNDYAKQMAITNNKITFWNELLDDENREAILASNDNNISIFINDVNTSVRDTTGHLKAMGALFGNKPVSSNYTPYLLKQAKYDVPKRFKQKDFIYHGTLETVKQKLAAYFNAIIAAKDDVSVVRMESEITFQNLGSFLNSTEYKNMFVQLGRTELYKSDGFAPSLHDGEDNNVAISLFEAKQAKMMDIYACLQVLIEALDNSVRTGIDENDISTLFDSHFCDLVGCDFAELRHTLFLMLRKIGYTLYHTEQAIFFERMQAAVVTKNPDVESAKENHTPIRFLNLADMVDIDTNMANAITAYNHQVIQGYLEFFTQSMQREHKKRLSSWMSTKKDDQTTVKDDDNFFLAALNSLNNIENAGEFCCQYKIEYESGKYNESFTQSADLINAYPKPEQFIILQEPHYAEPKLQPAIVNLPEELPTENIVPSMPSNALYMKASTVNISDAVSLIKQYEQDKEISQQSLSIFTNGDTTKTVNEHTLKQDSFCESRYPIIKYHIIPINCFGTKSTLGIIGEKIALLTSLQYAYYRLLLILSDMKQNLINNNADFTMDFRQAFPELIETLEGNVGMKVEDTCQLRLDVLKKIEQELIDKLHLIECRLYMGMQARYVEQIEASVSATKGITDENGVPVITLLSSTSADIHKDAQKQPLKFLPINDQGLDKIIEENNRSITSYYNRIKEGLETCKKSMQKQFRENRAQYGLTRVLLLREEDLSIPVDQNTIYLQLKNGFLTAYWIKKEVESQSFFQAEIPEDIMAFLPSPGESSDNKELIEAVRVKFKCMSYGNSHPENNPSYFITINHVDAKSLPIPQNSAPISINAYQTCIKHIPLYEESTLYALDKITAYAAKLRDFLREKDNAEIQALEPKDESDNKTFLAIFTLFKLLAQYLHHLKNPKKNAEKTPKEHVSGIVEQIGTLKNICVSDDSKSQIAMVAYSQFLGVFNQLIGELDKKESTENKKDNNIVGQMTRAFSNSASRMSLFAKSEKQENNENLKLSELLEVLNNNSFPSKEYKSDVSPPVNQGPY